jgi:Mg2+/Co2+ transporter CorB
VQLSKQKACYRLKVLAKTNKNAKRTERLLENLDHLIGTILLGNNLVQSVIDGCILPNDQSATVNLF